MFKNQTKHNKQNKWTVLKYINYLYLRENNEKINCHKRQNRKQNTNLSKSCVNNDNFSCPMIFLGAMEFMTRYLSELWRYFWKTCTYTTELSSLNAELSQNNVQHEHTPQTTKLNWMKTWMLWRHLPLQITAHAHSKNIDFTIFFLTLLIIYMHVLFSFIYRELLNVFLLLKVSYKSSLFPVQWIYLESLFTVGVANNALQEQVIKVG